MHFFKVLCRELYQIYDNIHFEIIQLRLRKEAKRRHELQKRANAGVQVSSAPALSRYKNKASWYCGDCHKYNELFVDKFAAELASEWDKIERCCMYCAGTHIVDSTSTFSSDPDDEVVEFWMRNEDAYFWPQDEDLLLSTLPTRHIITLLNRCAVGGFSKGSSLIEALLVQFRDDTCRESERESLVSWLKENRPVWDQPHVWEYLRHDVSEGLKAKESQTM